MIYPGYQWVIKDYLQRVLGYVTVKVSKIVETLSGNMIKMRGWKFKYIFNDEFEQTKPSQIINVDFDKQKVTVSFKPILYKLEAAEEWARGLLNGFFDVTEEVKNPLKEFFENNDDVVDLINMLLLNLKKYLEDGDVHVVHCLNVFDFSTQNKDVESYLKEAIEEADDLAETLYC